jgi:hypothetical protein
MIQLLLLAAAAAPQISSEPIDANRFRLSIGGGPAEVAAAQAALLPTARRLCGARTAAFGTFKIEKGIEQEVLCTSGRAAINPAEAARPGWQPTDLDQQAVLAATYAYFAAKDSGLYSRAWQSLSDRMKLMSPAAPWQAKAAEFNREAGPVRARRVVELTWYNNPPDAPEPGIFVAADYSADFERLEFVCGYVMWLLQPDGSFRLVREEQNMLDKETAKKVPSLDRAPLKAQMGCKG